VLNLQGRLARQIGAVNLAFTSELEGKDILRHAFSDKQVLIVLDDLWDVDNADFFMVTSPPSLILITTRNRDVIVGLGADEHLMAALSPTDALQMLATWAGEKEPENVPQVGYLVAKECGYLPLALAMIGGMIRLGNKSTAWNDALSRLQLVNLEAIKRTFTGYPYPNLARAIEVSIEALDTFDHERYLNLAVFPEDELIPETPLRILWGLDDLDTRDCMARFVGRSLVTQAASLDGELRIRMHDLLGDLIRKRREREVPALHRRLVSAWTDLKRLPDLYAWRWIGYHLVRAERGEELRSLLLDFDWLQAKVDATDVLALIDDYDHLKREEVISLIQSAIRLSAHAVILDATQLAGQLVGRLTGESQPAIRKILRQASEWDGAPWLRPVRGNLHPPGRALMRILSGHTDKISASAITPDGRRVVSGSHDRTVRIWDLDRGRELLTFQGHESAVSSLAITANGRFAVTGSHDGIIKVWELETGKESHTFKQGSDVVSSVVINASGRWIISGASDGFLRIWSLQTAELVHTVRAHQSAVTGVALSRDGRLAVSASDDTTLKVWDTATWRELRILRDHAAAVTAVAVSPEGLRLASGSEDRTIKVWQMSTGRTMKTLTGHEGPVTAVAFTPDGTQIVSASYDKTLAVWDLTTSARRKLQGHTHFVTTAAVNPRGRVLVSGSWDRTLMVWDPENKRGHRPPLGRWDAVTSVAVSQDSRFALSTSYDQNITLWNLQTAKEVRRFWHDMTMMCLGISSDGLWAISGSTNGIIKVWEINSGKELVRLGHQFSVTAVAFYSDKSRAISGAADGTLKLWDLIKAEELATLQGHSAAVSALCMGSSMRWAISSSEDRTLKVWDLINQKEVWTLRGHDHLVTAIGVSKDLELAVSGSRDTTVRIWHPLLGAEQRTLRGHTGGVNAVAISPDGTLAVSGGDDHTLKVWLPKTGECLSNFTGEGAITCCSIAPDNRSIVAGEVSGRIHFLRLEATESLAEMDTSPRQYD
jgi:WD40 repeat protein